jgi:hypothetical protein
MKTDLIKMNTIEILHSTHKEIYETGTLKRDFGKTFYFANILKGYLEVLENENIYVILENKNCFKEFVDTFFKLDEVSLLQPKFKKNISKIDFNNNSNKVLFKVRDDEFRGIDNRKVIPICDLDDLPRWFFEELNINTETVLNNFLPTIRTTTFTETYLHNHYF